MALVFSVPGKAFIAGEYLALSGGMTLMAMTDPRFEFRVTEGRGERKGIPAGSPADLFIQRNSEFFSKLDVHFFDPHQGAGGWGASTAQYLSAFALYSWKNASNDEVTLELDTKALLDSYRQDAWDGKGVAPSGADLIGQLKGGFTFFEKSTGMISQMAWPFVSYEGYLLKTGEKVPTHEHLRKLTSSDYSFLSPLMGEIKHAWSSGDGELFADAVTNYGKQLAKKNHVADKTLNILHDLFWLNGVRAAKGCGALGADVVFILLEKNAKRLFELWAQEQSYAIVNINESLSRGLDLKVEGTVRLPVFEEGIS